MRGERLRRHWLMELAGVVALAALSLCGRTAGASAPPLLAQARPDLSAEPAREPQAVVLNLSAAEKDWLARHPVVKVAFDPDWAPIEYIDEQGRPAGISCEYLKHLETVLKVRFEPLWTLPSWQRVLEGLGDGSINMASAVQKTEQRKSCLTFTSPYMSLPIAIFTKQAVLYADTGTLKGKPVAVVRGFAVHDYLTLHHPEIDVVPVDSLKTGLDLVTKGKVFAFIEVFVIGSHAISRHGFSDLHVAGAMDFRYEVSMGASIQHPELASILQKALSAVPETDRVRYYQRWFAVPFIYKTDYTVVWWIVAGAAVLLLLELQWNYRLERRVTQRTVELAHANASLERRVEERTAELANAYETLERRAGKLRALATELAQTENRERRRIAQVLHDDPQQLLAAAKLELSSVLSRVADPSLNVQVNRAITYLDQGIAALRSLTTELSPPILHEAGFVDALQWLAGWMEEKHKLIVAVAGAPLPEPMSEEVSGLLFRCVRELLFNVVKHAGVRHARVTVEPANDGLRITVADEGRGFDVTVERASMTRTFGLFSIQERLALINGRMDITSVPGQGTSVVLSVPVAMLLNP